MKVKVGDVVKYVGTNKDLVHLFTTGKKYAVVRVGPRQIYVKDDGGRFNYMVEEEYVLDSGIKRNLPAWF